MDNYMGDLVDACKERKYTKNEALIMGIMAGCEEAHEVYGSSKKAFEAATEIVKKSGTPEEAIGTFKKTFLD